MLFEYMMMNCVVHHVITYAKWEQNSNGDDLCIAKLLDIDDEDQEGFFE